MNMIKAVIFDFNGTMFQDDDKHVISWKAFALQEFSYHLSDEEFPLHIHGYSNYEILKYLSGKEFSKKEVKEYATRKELQYQKICEADQDNLHLTSGIVPFLDALKERGVPLYICTASMEPNVLWYLKVFELEKWFPRSHIIFDDGTIEHGKPDPEIYQKAIAKTGVLPEECLVFEDTRSGILSASRAGVKHIIAISEKGKELKKEEQINVDAFLPDFENVPEVLMKLSL